MSEHSDTTLGALTSGWEAASTVPAGDLERARAALAAGLTRGKTPAELDLAIALKPARSGAAATATPAAAQAPGFAQSALATSLDNPLGVPAWANGMEQGERLGPFLDPLGVGNIVITIPLTLSKTFAFGSAAAGFALLPVTGAPASATNFTLGAGSVWLAAQLLAPTAAAGSFCGFLISGGTLTASATVTLQGGTYVVPTGATLTLTATLAPPAAGTGSPGADLTSAEVTIPPTVTIQLTQTAATVEALGNASLGVYGTSLSLTWNKAAPLFVPNLSVVLVPCTSSVSTFAFTTVHSTLFEPSGSAPIVGAGWALPVATAAIGSLGEAKGAGSLLVGLGAGGTFTGTSRTSSPVAGWQIAIDPQTLLVVVGGQGGGGQASYTLWPGLPPGKLPASIAWTNPGAYLASFLATPGHETLTVSGQATAYLDRPLAADGGRFPIAGNGSLALAVDAGGTTATILVTTTPPTDPYAIALENALIGVRAPQLFFAAGPVEGTAFTSCKVTLILATTYLVPTLPDPYAANFELTTLVSGDQAAATGLLGLGLSWSGGAAVTFGFSIGASTSTAILAQPAGVFAPPGPGLTLLDLSTRADLFGVTIPALPAGVPPVPPDPGFVGLSLALPDTQVATFALPQMSWEPMESTGPEPPLGPIAASPATDGVTTVVRAQDPKQTLVPFAPAPVLRQNIANVVAGGTFTAQFSLPFGLIAHVSQGNEPPTGGKKALFLREGGAFELVRPRFPGNVGGAFQLMLKPPDPTQPKAQFSGTTIVSTAGDAPGYGYDVLSSDIGTIFQNEFGTAAGGAVPVRRIDLAGYGASLFSEWSDDAATGTAIIKVQFETIVGRTAFEVVKAQTTLYPYCVKLVRTITIARQNGGWVQRSDSGWVAVTDGKFDFPERGVPPKSGQSGGGCRCLQRAQRARVRDRDRRRLHLSPRALRCRYRARSPGQGDPGRRRFVADRYRRPPGHPGTGARPHRLCADRPRRVCIRAAAAKAHPCPGRPCPVVSRGRADHQQLFLRCPGGRNGKCARDKFALRVGRDRHGDRGRFGAGIGRGIARRPGPAARRRLGLGQARQRHRRAQSLCRAISRCRWCSPKPIRATGISPTLPMYCSSAARRISTACCRTPAPSACCSSSRSSRI